MSFTNKSWTGATALPDVVCRLLDHVRCNGGKVVGFVVVVDDAFGWTPFFMDQEDSFVTLQRLANRFSLLICRLSKQRLLLYYDVDGVGWCFVLSCMDRRDDEEYLFFTNANFYDRSFLVMDSRALSATSNHTT